MMHKKHTNKKETKMTLKTQIKAGSQSCFCFFLKKKRFLFYITRKPENKIDKKNACYCGFVKEEIACWTT